MKICFRQVLLVTSGALLGCRSVGASQPSPLSASPTPGADDVAASPGGALAHTQPAPRVQTIAVGPHHGCAVGSNGALACWGTNERGELGHGFSSGWCAPSTVEAVGDVTAVALGPRYTCAVQAEHVVACWGDHPAAAVDPEAFPAEQRFDLKVPIAQIAAASDYACVRGRDGGVWCWGSGEAGQLGSGSGGGVTSPTRLDLEPVISIAVGDRIGCAVGSEGNLDCWGRVSELLVEQHPRSKVFGPTPIPGPPADLVLMAGPAPCVVDLDGALHCWLALTAGPTTAVSHPATLGVDRIESVLGITDDGSGCVRRRERNGVAAVACWRRSSLRNYGWPGYPDAPRGHTSERLALSSRSAEDGIVGCGSSGDAVECWSTSAGTFALPKIDFLRGGDPAAACSSLDTDADGIAGKADACTLEPETFNGREDNDGCPDEGRSLIEIGRRGTRIALLEEVAFTSPRSTIHPRSHAMLDHLAAALTAHTGFERLQIRVRSKRRGSGYGRTMARRRAQAIRDALVERGLDPRRIEIGEAPLARDAPQVQIAITRHATSPTPPGTR